MVENELFLTLSNNLLCNRLRNYFIMTRQHHRRCPPLSHTPEDCNIALHFCQWRECGDDGGCASRCGALDLCSARTEISNHISHKLLWCGNLKLHDRLEQHHTCGFYTFTHTE